VWKGSRVALAIGAFCCVVACGGTPRRTPTRLTAAEVALNNRAVGLMGQFEYGQARDIFARLAADHPDNLDLQVNLAIATLHRQNEGDSQAAQRILEQVLVKSAEQLRAHYNLGLLLLHDGRAAEALPHLSLVATRDPENAFAQYFVAQCRFQQSEFTAAVVAYERALTLNPHLRSAAYGAFQSRQRLARADAPQMLEAFRALEANPQSEVAEFKYTRLGPLADAATIDQPPAVAAARPAGAVFEPRAIRIDPLPALVSWRRFGAATATEQSRPLSITAADVDGDNQIDLFIAGAIADHGAVRNAVLLNRGEMRFVLDLRHPLAQVPDVEAALWGDIDNDGLTDVYLCARHANQLWRQTARGQWSKASVSAKAGGGGGTTIDGVLFDADHDGDLDVLLIKENGANELLSNNGDGTFRALGETVGLGAEGRPSRGVVVADLDGDRDADIIVVRVAPPHDVHINDRMWRYHADPAYGRITSTPIAAAVVGDLDADGSVAIYASSAGGILSGVGPETKVVSGTEALANARQLALADVDGDGRLDLVGTSTDGRWRALAIPATGSATPIYVEDGPPLAGWAIAQLDAGRGPSVVAIGADSDAGPLIWGPGSGRFPFVTVSLTGRDPRSRQIRSNASGIGTQITARAGSRWTALDTYRPQSGVGQSLQPIAIGTGGLPQVDFVALLWSDGVFQTEIDLAPSPPRTIAETQRQLSSCPVLFAFDGRRFAFVTDLLGVGGIGTPTGPGGYAEPRPRENVLLPEGALAARAGRFALKITEPMEEVAYIDSARLVAYDLPPGWQVALDERQSITDPIATGEPRFYRDERLPFQATAIDPATEDVTAAITKADGVAAPPGRVDPRHIGRTDPHRLELRFDRPLDAQAGAPLLVADGWIEYPYAQTLFAAWQAGAAYRAPTIAARGTDRQWHVLREAFGYPAGMPRRISVPLGRLPRGTTELRVDTTQEIYWDRMAIVYAAECPLVRKQTAALAVAKLARTGFAHHDVTSQRRPSYDYDRRSPFWDARYPRGFYTAEGPATDLLAQADGAVAIVGPGEELHLEFLDNLRALPAGWTRRFVLEARGWCKDMDLYTKDGDTVEPLPGVRNAAAERLQRQHTTRYQSGR